MDRFDWIEIASAPKPSEALSASQPVDAESFYKAGRRMRQAGHFRAASDFYERAVGLDAHRYTAWVEWIDTLVRANQVEAAMERSQYALDSFRQVRMLYAAHALALLHNEDYVEANRHIQVALEGETPSWYALMVQAEITLKCDAPRFQESLIWMEKACDAARSPWDAYFIGGWILLDARMPTLAAGYFAEAAHCNPHAPLSWMCLGDCFHVLRLYDQALFYYQRVIELEPTHTLAIERQKKSAPKKFGLLRAFRRSTLQDRWNEEFKRLKEEGERYLDEF